MPHPKNVVWAGASLAFGGVLFKVWLFGALVRFGIKDQTALRYRNEVRGIYLKIPFPLNFKIYFFNVTNPHEIQNGAKPVLNEVGPYWYDEYKERIDVIDNDTEDSLTYTPYDLFKFNANKSAPLSDHDYVTIIHPVIVGMVNLLLRDSPMLLKVVSKAIPFIFDEPKTIFITAKVKDLLFDGVVLNCTSKEFASTAVCGQMKGQVPGLKPLPGQPNLLLFSLLGPVTRNATTTNTLKVLRGIKHYQDLGRLLEVNGRKSAGIWGSEQCNRFDGTDSWIFPPLIQPEDGLRSYSTDLCRNIKMRLVNASVVKKVAVKVFETNLGDQSSDPEEKCYCRTEKTCSKRGVFDLTKCMGVPLFATLPHFLDTDPDYLKLVDGLQPNHDKHRIVVFFETMTGTPLKAAKRMQFNLELQPTDKLELFSKLPTALFPIFWLEEGVELDGYLLKKIQTIFMLFFLADVMIYLTIAAGLAGCGAGCYLYWKNTKSLSITPLSKRNGVNAGNGKEN